MNLKYAAIAAAMFAASATAASALPASNAGKAGEALRTGHAPALEQVVDRDRRRMLRKRDGRHHWRHRGWRDRDFDWNDRRYRKYRGWHRYHSRPYGWRDRGCIAVGPIWFCP